MVFSNPMGLMGRAILCRTSDKSPKKSNFTAILGANVAEN